MQSFFRSCTRPWFRTEFRHERKLFKTPQQKKKTYISKLPESDTAPLPAQPTPASTHDPNTQIVIDPQIHPETNPALPIRNTFFFQNPPSCSIFQPTIEVELYENRAYKFLQVEHLTIHGRLLCRIRTLSRPIATAYNFAHGRQQMQDVNAAQLLNDSDISQWFRTQTQIPLSRSLSPSFTNLAEGYFFFVASS